jgi:hypothetical protein
MSITLKEAILDLVKTRQNVSFVEIGRLEGATGAHGIGPGGGGNPENVIYWSGLSESAVDALLDLRAEGAIHYQPVSSVLVYLADGALMNLPRVKSVAALKRGYKKPHWLPVVINPGPG